MSWKSLIQIVIMFVVFYSGVYFAELDASNKVEQIAPEATFISDKPPNDVQSNITRNVLNIAGADINKLVVLINNKNSKQISYKELKAFIKEDDTDKILYDIENFVCADYAELLHNRAEEAGITCYFVSVEFVNPIIEGQEEFYGHALNAFYTTDRGLIYIDCTGYDTISTPKCHADHFVENVIVGQVMEHNFLYPNGRYINIKDMGFGEISSIEMFD